MPSAFARGLGFHQIHQGGFPNDSPRVIGAGERFRLGMFPWATEFLVLLAARWRETKKQKEEEEEEAKGLTSLSDPTARTADGGWPARGRAR